MASLKAGLFVITLILTVVLVYFTRDFYAGNGSNIASSREAGEKLDDNIHDGFINVHLENRQNVVRVFYREFNPLDKEIETGGVHGDDGDSEREKPMKMDVLLLHGRKFSSRTWLNLGTIRILGENGHRTVAVDLPGFGLSEGHASLRGETEKDQLSRAKFLKEIIEVLGLIRPAIVAPSFSGSFALPLLATRSRMFGAFIPVAPVHTERFPPEVYMKIKVPTLIVYGSKDKSARVSLHNLRYLPLHEVVELPDASHPAYLDQTAMWHARLKLFLNGQKVLH